jgi:peptidoglycan/LPS O-acetylase OafA/YrhL
MEAKQVVGLDFLRFLAASLVALFHLSAWCWLAPKGSLAPILGTGITFPGLATFSWLGWVGVEIFFVLSGFVIALSARNRSVMSFVRGRVKRLVPAAAICATITLAVAWFAGVYGATEAIFRFARAVLFVPFGPWIDGSYWTLGIEIAFYSLVSVAIFVKRIERLDVVMGVIGAASTIAWFVAGFVLKDISFLEQRLTMLSLLSHGCLFAIGVLIWAICNKGLNVSRSVFLAISIVGACIETYFSAGEKLKSMSLGYDPAVAVALVLVSIAFVFGSIRFNAAISALVGRRGQVVARQLGLMTYPFYLLHAVVGAILIRAFFRAGFTAPVALFLTLALLVLVSMAVALFGEPWLRGVIDQAFAKSTGRAKSSA